MDIRVISPDDGFHRVHTYFKGSPYHPDGQRVLYTPASAACATRPRCA